MEPKILSTISDGSLGKEIITRINMIGEEIRAGISCSSLSEPPFNYSHVNAVHFDFNRNESVEVNLDGIEKIILIVPCDPNLDLFVSNIIENVKRSTQVKYILFLSFLGVRIDPSSAIANWYQSAEQKIMDSGLPFTIVRPNFPLQRLVEFIDPQNGTFSLPISDAKISFIDERDTAAAISEIILSPYKHLKKIYELTGLEAENLAFISEIFTQTSGNKINYVDIDESQARQFLQKNEVADMLVNPLVKYFKFLSSGQASRITKSFQTITDYLPTTILDFARDYADIIRKRFDAKEPFKASPWFT